MKIPHSRPKQELIQVNGAILLAFAAVALMLIFWSVVRAPAILAREDNPRQVIAELRIRRGSILDRHNFVLAETVGTAEEQNRRYPMPTAGPAVGYYSFRHGVAGIEESYDPILRGETGTFWSDFIRRTLHQPQVGQDVRLTLDAGLQDTAVSLLHDHTGALILLQLGEQRAEILALASQPGYDPNRLDAQFDALATAAGAPLLNRVTQGQYQPGLVLQPFILASALEAGALDLEGTVTNANRPVPLHGFGARCNNRPPTPTTWSDVLRYHCPGPMLDLASRLGATGVGQSFASFGLTAAPQLPLETAQPAAAPPADEEQAAIGQDTLIVTPLQVALAWAALAGNGRLPTPELVAAVQAADGTWQPPADQSTDQPPAQAISPETAVAIRAALPQIDNVLEYSRLILSGPAGSKNGWYLGMAPAVSPRYVVVIIVENSDDLAAIERRGRQLLQTAVSQNR